jgi:hypothetical protein
MKSAFLYRDVVDYGKSLRIKPEEWRVLDFMRTAMASQGRMKAQMIIIRGLSDLITSKYSDHQTAIRLFRDSMRRVGRETPHPDRGEEGGRPIQPRIGEGDHREAGVE